MPVKKFANVNILKRKEHFSMKKTSILFSKVVIGIAVLVLIINPLTGCSSKVELEKSAITENIEGSNTNLELVSVAIEDVDDTGYLVLVNLQYTLITEFDEDKYVQVLSFVPTAPVGVQDMYLHPSAMTAYVEMRKAAGKAGVEFLGVSSGFRSTDEQRELYYGSADSDYVLPPGHSEHLTGLAVDITIQGISGAEFGNSSGGRWIADNAYKFGLILRYPEGAEAVTGINYEPWHFRYVGSVHAYYMKQNNLVLEEYIQLIQEQGSLYFEKDGVTYYILYQVPQNGMIDLPDGLDFIISSDNTGGYIVTAW